MTDVLLLVMICWLAGLATGISAARLSIWVNHDRLNHGRVHRGNGSGSPTTPKPNIIPKPQFPPPRKIREDFLP